MSSYLQKVLRFKVPPESSQVNSLKSLDEEETKYSLKSESIAFNESLLKDFHESLTDSINEGTETNFIQKVPVLACTPTRHNKQDITQAFYQAISEDSTDLCKLMLEKYSNGEQLVDINYIGPDNQAALHIAASEDYLKLCEIILDYAEQPHLNIRNSNMQTPLHIACNKGHLKVAQLLARSGADINCIDKDGNTSLHLASVNGYGMIVA